MWGKWLLLLALLAGCRSRLDPRDDRGRQVLRVGYLLNLTHAPALEGLSSGRFSRAVGPGATVEGRAFSGGALVLEALFAGELDVGYVGPNPALNAFARSEGQALRLLAGATYGGAELVVAPEVGSPMALRGRRVGSPALGSTQDVALRRWLRAQGLAAQVEVLPLPPPELVTLFRQGELAGAWVAEPWASRLVLEERGRVLVDEAALWPQGRHPTTVVVVSTASLRHRGELLERFLAGHAEAVDALSSPQARREVASALARATGKALAPGTLERAFARLSFSAEVPPQLARLAEDAQEAGLLPEADLAGLVPSLPLAQRAPAPGRAR